jgi:hypothetical protein
VGARREILLAGVVFGQDLVIRGRCIGVHDGDSCTLLATGNVQIEVRVAFSDAPELGQAFGYRWPGLPKLNLPQNDRFTIGQ